MAMRKSVWMLRSLCAVFLILLLACPLWLKKDSIAYKITYNHFQQTEPVSANLHCHGESPCLPDLRTFPASELENNTRLCQDLYTNTLQPNEHARIATVTAQFGEPHDHYQRALRTHLRHSIVHKSPVHILNSKVVDDLWNKPAFILELLLEEMAKPEDERLEWLFWVDRDTIILNNCRSPASFLPPSERREGSISARSDDDQINGPHLVVTKDWNGLNNGVFLLRVHHWSIELFTAIMAYRYYRPGVKLPFTEQSAMGLLIEERQFADDVAWVPQWWFNAYPMGEEEFSFNGTQRHSDYHAIPGDFLVHFAGVGDRGKRMGPWLDVAESAAQTWLTGPPKRDMNKEIKKYWEKKESE